MGRFEIVGPTIYPGSGPGYGLSASSAPDGPDPLSPEATGPATFRTTAPLGPEDASIAPAVRATGVPRQSHGASSAHGEPEEAD